MHAVWIGAILVHMDFVDEQIGTLTVTIGEQIPLSSEPLSCCARSPGFNGAPPRA
jgi:hypothetical protein